MDVKQRIRAIIDSRKDLTVRGVSLAAGLSDSLLHKYLTKPEHSMTIDNLQKIADAMGVPLRDILFDNEPEIVNIWDRIPQGSREQARRMLVALADESLAG